MLEPLALQAPFRFWPLHITLVPWFKAGNAESVAAAIAPVVAAVTPFTVTAGERAMFGPRQNVPVRRIKASAALQSLHGLLLDAVEEQGWEVAGRYTGKHYTPHVTQKAGRDAEEQIFISNIHIVEAMPQSYRQAVAKLELGRE